MTGAKFEEITDDAQDGRNGRDTIFGSLYGKVRKVFSDNPDKLDSLAEQDTYKDKINFLLSLQTVKSCLDSIQPNRQVPDPCRTCCDGDLKEAKQWRDAPKLAYGRNKNYPNLSSAVEVKQSAEEGRYLSAKQRILPGDVLIVDQPYITSLFSTHYKTHCLNCMRRLTDVFVECSFCKLVRFCDETCYNEAFQKSHRWECNVLEIIDNDDIGRMATIAYRTVSKAGYEFLTSMGDQLGSIPPTYQPGDYHSVYHQIDNMDKRPTGDHLKRGFTALLLARCLQLSGWFPKSDGYTEEFVFAASLLMRHIQACACNAYEINEFVRKGDSMINCESAELGGAVYPTISLSNHACASNTLRTSYGTYCCVRAISTIQPSEKIYDNYGLFYHTSDKEERQNRLKLQYFFNCQCKACKQNWPMYRDFAGVTATLHCPWCGTRLGNNLDKLKKCSKCKKDLKGLTKLVSHLDKLQKNFRSVMDEITEETAPDYIQSYSRLLTQIEKIYKQPCRQITECQQVLLQSCAILGNYSNVKPTAEESQVALFTNTSQESSDEDQSDSDDDIPGLI